ncbi:hypothetical protein LPB140_06675 [Sphingorhabdus lutea]|uniref:DNA polymerase III subunit gamma/tau n=1 Tax=Sphingorhabdus lutea TaxID=1913578 RepID=A0A1L3JBJ4_9SPHN|nr:DNA polymerase III subunit gamma/tau [Sphingorhabdus lutea]APG62517.1 hypothetical protein LPB140_06675 [Sphingorhabdus lutea]
MNDSNQNNDEVPVPHDEEIGFDLGGQAPTANAAPSGNGIYRVLARKYRPSKFSELIGQDAMVQTLANAIKRERLAHAFLMTGVRGVGKTSTARLIAKALNCIGADGQGGPTIDPCGQCEPCIAIGEGRHMDVIEMDAASHTGVNDVREIIEAVRYASVSARYKIYIIDEVHMLSTNAFNALLKTLEEPPEHVKFLFATTEVDKVPITVLSRCQRFDLKRISSELLAKHFTQIIALENCEAEEEAIALIAQAAEGSVRDGLSILDQAIAHSDFEGDGKILSAKVRDMLGLSDRGAIRDLMQSLLDGDGKMALTHANSQYDLGVDPKAIINGLMREVHLISIAQIGAPQDQSMSKEGQEKREKWAQNISAPRLQMFWQLLLQGLEDLRRGSVPTQCCDMIILRIIHATKMPDPSDLAKLLQNGMAGVNAGPNSGPNSGPSNEPSAQASNVQFSNAQIGIASSIALADSSVSNGSAFVGEEVAALENAPQQKSVEQNIASQKIEHGKENVHHPYKEGDAQKIVKLPSSFEALISLVGTKFPAIEADLRDVVRLVEYDVTQSPPNLFYQLAGKVFPRFEQDLSHALFQLTNIRWNLAVKEGEAQPSEYEVEIAKVEQARQEILNSPMVKSIMSTFPNAQLIEDETIENHQDENIMNQQNMRSA